MDCDEMDRVDDETPTLLSEVKIISGRDSNLLSGTGILSDSRRYASIFYRFFKGIPVALLKWNMSAHGKSNRTPDGLFSLYIS